MGEADTAVTHPTVKMFPVTTCECSPPELRALMETVDDYNRLDENHQVTVQPLLSIKIKPKETENGKTPVVLESADQEPPSPLFWSKYVKNLEEIMQ